MTIQQLLERRVLLVATQPAMNDGDIAARQLTLPLIAEDYPAKTAVMWNTAYRTLGMPVTNIMMLGDPASTREILEVFRADERYVGGGAGVGFKEAVLPFLDAVTPLARSIGAVNIIRKTVDGLLEGDNTDGAGYAMSLEEKLSQRGGSLALSTVLIIGAGGTGRAIAFTLADRGATVIIANRTAAKAEELAQSLCDFFGRKVASGGGRELIEQSIAAVDVIVSVVDDAHSPLDEYSTLGDMTLPITPESIDLNQETASQILKKARPGTVVSDIRIRKKPTAMLSMAEAAGFTTLDGIPMVINQGARAFLWVHRSERDLDQDDDLSMLVSTMQAAASQG